MSLIDSLNWRYATKKMNGEVVPEEKIEKIVEAARLAPTSSGLQPFKVLVISNPELKKQLQPASFNQSQIVDSSHVLVFAAWDNYSEERIDEVFARGNAERGLPAAATADYQTTLKGMYLGREPEVNHNHAARQAYIAFGLSIAQAAELEVDATPMEGFDPQQYDEILGLKDQGLRSVCVLALGYRDTTGDWLVNMKKIRRAKADFVVEYK